MNEVEFKAILVAITELVAETPDKKPNVKDVEDLVGFDVSADERDEVYQAYLDGERVTDDTPDEADEADEADELESATVTNNTNGPLSIQGVTIEAKSSKSIPSLNQTNAVVKLWIERGVIEIG